MHPARDRGLVELQCAALRHLEERAPHLPLPRVVPTSAGETVTLAPGPDGAPRLVFVLTWLPGTTLAEARPRAPETLASLGRLLGEMDGALRDFAHPGAHRDFPWDLSRASWIRGALGQVADPLRRALVERALDRYEAEVVPALSRLRRGVIHGDANDHNVIVGAPRAHPREVSGLLDFGDMHHGLLVAEPAVAAAYALLGQEDPLAAAAAVVAGYHAAFPLEEEEIRAPLRPGERPPRGERDELGGEGEARAGRPLRHGERGPRLGGARAARPHPPPLRALRLPRGVRPAAVPARPGRRLVARAGGGGAGAGRGPARRRRASSSTSAWAASSWAPTRATWRPGRSPSGSSAR